MFLEKNGGRGLDAMVSQHCLSGLTTNQFASVDTAKAHASVGDVSRQPSFLANVLLSG